MLFKRVARGASVLRAGLVALVIGAGFGEATASKLKTLHTFCKSGFCDDGNWPSGSLLRDSAGNIFGTTKLGGVGCQYGCGLVYRITPALGKKGFKPIYKFCKGGNCDKGSNPDSGLILDVNGNLYGVATGNGKHTYGGIFRLSPDGKNYAVLHSFCAKPDCSDGGDAFNPATALTYQGAASGAPYDGISPLYGVTMTGGAYNSGLVYKLAPPGDGKAWKYTVLYSFCSQDKCADGKSPIDLVADASGNLYGTTFYGGGNNIDQDQSGGGTVFELTGKSLQKIYAFCAEANCSDGEYPQAVVIDGQGNLVGVTEYGGNAGAGTIFKIDTGGVHGKLYDFCSQTDCTDGSFPGAPPYIDGSGNLFGVAGLGGSHNGGMVYKFDGALHVLYNFCSLGGAECSDGSTPKAPLIPDGAGNFYGETWTGGAGFGTVFELTP
jgi:uncharacterized repeat protein (TIGR03803 family)